jgi:hypothetical protein
MDLLIWLEAEKLAEEEWNKREEEWIQNRIRIISSYIGF